MREKWSQRCLAASLCSSSELMLATGAAVCVLAAILVLLLAGSPLWTT
jgi:hypothetical protein